MLCPYPPLRISFHLTCSTAGPAKKFSAPIELIQCIVSMVVGGWPVSSASNLVNSSLRSSITLSALAMTAARSAGGVEGHGPVSNALRAAATAASTSAAAARGTLPTYSPVAGQCTSMTSEVDGSVHLPPINSLSYSVFWLSGICAAPPHRSALHRRQRHGATLPSRRQNENRFQSTGGCGCSTSTRLLTRNSRSTGAEIIHHAHRGW